MPTDTTQAQSDSVERFIQTLSDVPADRVSLALAPLWFGRQAKRLQKRTDSFWDRPTPLPLLATLLSLPMAVRHLTDALELRELTPPERLNSLWLGELKGAILVHASASGVSARYIMRDGQRTLVLSPRLLSRPEAVQREFVASAERNDTTDTAVALTSQALAVLVERALWLAVVGEREKLSRPRAYTFVALEFGRQAALRRLRPAAARRRRAAR